MWGYALAAMAADPVVESGRYRELKLAFDPKTQEVTGFYENYSGENQAFSCIFALRGTLMNGTAAIKTAFPGDAQTIPGMLSVSGKEVQIQLESEPGGCWNVEYFVTPETAFFYLSAPVPWVAVRVVKADRAYFHDAPGGPRRKAWVVKKDVVGVREIREGWVLAEYTNTAGKTTTGWIAASDLFALP